MGYITLNKNNFISSVKYYTNILQDINKICIALKDNAYGHGIEQIASLSSLCGIRHSMVRNNYEAKIVSNYDFDTILILYDYPTQTNNLYQNKNIIYAINDISKIPSFLPQTQVELKIDTGMSRNGILIDQINQAIELISKHDLKLFGVFTHFCCADEIDDKYTLQQEQKFQQAIKMIKQHITKPFRIHCANSTAVHQINNDLYDIARIGIGLYGYLYRYEAPLKPVMSLYANKISTRVLNKDDHIGYGAIFKAPCDNFKVSNYDIGYSDGFFRLNETKKATLPNGKQILGRVSMDSFTIEGDEEIVTLFDDVTQLALIHDTIYYEILTNLKSHLQRIIV